MQEQLPAVTLCILVPADRQTSSNSTSCSDVAMALSPMELEELQAKINNLASTLVGEPPKTRSRSRDRERTWDRDRRKSRSRSRRDGPGTLPRRYESGEVVLRERENRRDRDRDRTRERDRDRDRDRSDGWRRDRASREPRDRNRDSRSRQTVSCSFWCCVFCLVAVSLCLF